MSEGQYWTGGKHAEMLRKINGQLHGPFPTFADYYRGKGLLAKLIMPLTKRLRVLQVMTLMTPKDRHLDIGCGDGYLLKCSVCMDCWGMDLIYGDDLSNSLPFPDNFFNYVTMLAVFEHLKHPDHVFREVHRVLKQGGELIITTPKAKGEWLMHLYAGKEDVDHQHYYDREEVLALSQGLFCIEIARSFLFGFNQLFSLKK